MAMKSPVRKVIKKDRGPRTMDNAQTIVEQVHQLAWTGQHAQAVDLASQALSSSGLKPGIQMDLLDLRAESYIAQGKLDLAAKDAAAMFKIANAEKIPALQAQAFHRKAHVQINKGDLKAALKTA